MNRRRLEVEAWRDAMLAVADRLDPTLGGPSVSLDSAANRRRTYYAAISRHDLSSLLRLFDFPDPNITSGGRVETTVPLQQLFVLNSDFMIQAARGLTSRLKAHSHPTDDDASRIRQAYLWLFGRPANDREIGIGLAFLQSQADPERSTSSTVWHAAGGGETGKPGPSARDGLSRWERYAQALLAANEFTYID
jgi:hypothetical protein